ncbi:MAG: hypothetical protein OEL75_03175 [Kiritimatiellaceae bacterium]|nr:hypothetical protein [Kiritimatiellaceae bacterium]
MLLKGSIKKILAKRGYKHWESDAEFTRHGDYARNLQYAFSKEFSSPETKIVDIIFLSVDMRDEKLVIGFCRENLSIENGVLENISASIPLVKFSLDEFEKQLNRLIPKKDPVLKVKPGQHNF